VLHLCLRHRSFLQPELALPMRSEALHDFDSTRIPDAKRIRCARNGSEIRGLHLELF
jgi:phage gpG-like protein